MSTTATQTADDLSGLYPANKEHGKNGGYPDTAEQVLVGRPDRDGYHDVTMLDAEGNIVAENNRPRHRIKGALADGEGYDLIVFEA